MALSAEATKAEDESMELTITGHHRDICQDFERTFWIPPGGGFVREVTPDKPGVLGKQVCSGLAHTGSTLTATDANFASTIRRERARERRAEARVDWACSH